MEYQTSKLLWDYEQRYGDVDCYQIPIEELAEKHLGLCLEIVEEDEDILGCINIEDKVISINEAIYPEDVYAKAGRYRFTLGHEIGHWVLHAPYVFSQKANLSLFDQESDADKTILCRDSNKRAREEHQADYFSSALLMPKNLLCRAWEPHTGEKHALFTNRVVGSISTAHNSWSKLGKSALDEKSCLEIWVKRNGLADAFNVSAEAMVIRLKQLGFLKEDHNNLQFRY